MPPFGIQRLPMPCSLNQYEVGIFTCFLMSVFASYENSGIYKSHLCGIHLFILSPQRNACLWQRGPFLQGNKEMAWGFFLFLFLIQPTNLCLLIGEVILLIFRIINDNS